MKIVSFSYENSHKWDDFAMRNDDAWFWYTTDWMQYCLNSQFGVTTLNRSFCLIENNSITALVPLIIEKKKVDGKELAEIFYGGWPTPVPVVETSKSQNKRDRIYKYIFDNIDNIANENNAQRSVFRIYNAYPIYKRGDIVFNFIMKYGYADISLNTQVINVRLKERDIFNSFNKGSKRNIRKSDKYLTVEFCDYKNNSRDQYDMFKTFYFRIAGKITRPNECLEVLYRLILKGNVFIAFALYNNSIVGVQMVIHYKSGAYYLFSAVEKEFNCCSIGHFLQWNVIKYLKDKGIDYYEVGIQQYGNTIYDFPTEKDINISAFKRRFGGVTVPIFTGEKIYSSEYYQTCFQGRVNKYLEIMY